MCRIVPLTVQNVNFEAVRQNAVIDEGHQEIEGLLFRVRYLGSTQLLSEGSLSNAKRMMQAKEAVSTIKVGNRHIK